MTETTAEKKKILLAFYSKTITSFLKKNLEDNNFEVSTASDGIDAVQKACTVHPDCILVCTDLSVIDPYAFTRIIKNTDYLKDIAVLICSIDDNDIYKFMSDNSICDGNCFLKHCTITKLIKNIHEILQKYENCKKGARRAELSQNEFINLMSNAHDKELFELYVVKQAFNAESKTYDIQTLFDSMCSNLLTIFEYDAFSFIIDGEIHAEFISRSKMLPKSETEDFLQIVRTDHAEAFKDTSSSNWLSVKQYSHTFVPNQKDRNKIRTYENFPLDKKIKGYTAHIAVCKDGIISARTRDRLNKFIYTYYKLMEKALAFNIIAESEQKIEKAFSRFLPPTIIKRIINEEDSLTSSVGEKRQVAILISDIRNFTNISEQNSPEDIVAFLNYFFARMGKIIQKHGGTIDKFMGDAIMALFGAPESYIYNGNRAANAALEMIEDLKNVDTSKLNMGDYKFKVGIGIHYGKPIVGSIGSEEKKEYTVIGDDVNLASRVESLTKLYGTNILITESVKKDIDTVNESVRCNNLIESEEPSLSHITRLIDNVKVKGKSQAVHIYSISSDTSLRSESFLENYRKGLNQYEIGNFKTAQEYFQNALQEYPNDTASHVLLERCKEFFESKPDNWDGAISLTTK